MRAHLTVYQSPRNPTPRERQILTLLVKGLTQKQTAQTLRLAYHSVTNALGEMRARYTAPTNESLIALAVRLQWISLAIDCTESLDTVAPKA